MPPPRFTAEVFAKHRLELFSDGVFAILLTLLVLELKPPRLGGLAGLAETLPDIGLHALAFTAVAVAWVSHYRALNILPRINPGILWVNLLALFPVTLIPFGLKIDADTPADPFGAAFLGLDLAAYGAALALLRWVGDPVLRDQPALAAFNRRRALALVVFAAAAAGVSIGGYRWFGGYAVAIATLPFALFLPPAPTQEATGA